MLLIRYGLIRERSVLGWLVLRIPRRWFYVTHARVGNDTNTYLMVQFKR
jgi:hypothetical protein